MTAPCRCWMAVAADDICCSLNESMRRNLRQWEGHGRPPCMHCPPPSSSSEEDSPSSSSFDDGDSDPPRVLQPLQRLHMDYMLCMQCGVVCCANHADLHCQEQPAHATLEPTVGGGAQSGEQPHSCFFSLCTSRRASVANCRRCGTSLPASVILSRLSDQTRTFLTHVDASHRIALEAGHINQGLPNVLGNCSFMNAVLQCLLGTPTFGTAIAHIHPAALMPQIDDCDTLRWFVTMLKCSVEDPSPSASYATSKHNRKLTTRLHEVHRRGLLLADDNNSAVCEGETDCCLYWDFVISCVDAEVAKLPVMSSNALPQLLPGSLAFGLGQTSKKSESTTTYGLHLSLPPSLPFGDSPVVEELQPIQLTDLLRQGNDASALRSDAAVVCLLDRFSILPNAVVVKDCRRVSFPLTLAVSLTTRRRLLGVVAHRGSLSTGHHYSYVRRSHHTLPQHWILCDDLHVHEVPEELILNEPCASILVYSPVETLEEDAPPPPVG